MTDKNAHCGYCGSKYTSDLWPRFCTACQNTTWRNPTPVVVVRCIIHLPNIKYGVVAIRRSIPPHIGELTLPGGYLDFGESWQEGASRELFEEIGTKVDPNNFNLVEVITSPLNSNLLLFCDTYLWRDQLFPLVPNSEVSEMVVLDSFQELAFPSHTQSIKRFFESD